MKELTKVKKFTDWMNEGFDGVFIDSYHSYQCTKRLSLGDGTTLSIQAGRTHYCSPRENAQIADYDFYYEFEIGFPSAEIAEIMPFADSLEGPTESVYGYVPKEIINQLIAARGGVTGFQS